MKPKTIKITQVSVIVATKNEEKNIDRCLKSIRNQPTKAEIIVVDNFSNDKTVQIAKEFTSKVYLFGNERSKQRNFGTKKTRGEYLLFLDADMELPPNLLKECLQQFKRNSKISGIIIDEESTGHNFLSRVKSLEKRLTRRETVIEAARFFKKTDLLKMSGFDEDLISGEDWDLSIRMRKLGSLARVKSKIVHHEDKTFWQDVKKKYYYAKNIQKYAKKHPQEFEKQAGYWRFSSLFKKPKIIYDDPTAFLGLVFLKSAQYLAYLIARI